jgi:hypothetical protein
VSTQTQSKSKKKRHRGTGVPYERADGVVYIGKGAADRLVADGVAVVDKSKKKFAIRQRLMQSAVGGKRFVVTERWGDCFQVPALVDPHTNRIVASVHNRHRGFALGPQAWAQRRALMENQQAKLK